MTNKINYWILMINSLNIDLSLIETNEVIQFKYDLKDKLGDSNKLSKNDLILGYDKRTQSLKYLFRINNLSNDELILEKCFSVFRGGFIEDSKFETMLNDTDFIEVEEKDFMEFYNKLINSIPVFHDSNFRDSNFNKKRNRIFFGAPGTGKSFKLDQEKKVLLGEFNDNYERVTFHPDYSYASFVGSYRPVQDEKNGEKVISYDYVPGPFMRILSKAIIKDSEPFLLIIEEINRANVAAVFGDVFQLLDRNKNHCSEFSIDSSKEMRKYLLDELKKHGDKLDEKLDGLNDKFKKIRIPKNMFIWATMNSADQGVFFIDTAFKRRWDFEHIDVDDGQQKICHDEFKFPNRDENVNWNLLRKSLNDFLLVKLNVNEDKLIGPFFISDVVKFNRIDNQDFINSFKNKVLMYLYEDAAKSNPYLLFKGSKEKTYSKICKDFDKNGLDIFDKKIVQKYDELKKEYDKETNGKK